MSDKPLTDDEILDVEERLVARPHVPFALADERLALALYLRGPSRRGPSGERPRGPGAPQAPGRGAARLPRLLAGGTAAGATGGGRGDAGAALADKRFASVLPATRNGWAVIDPKAASIRAAVSTDSHA